MIFLAIRNLFRNIRRTIAILLTIALGAGALFAFQGFIDGVLRDYRENMIHSSYGNGQLHTQGYRENVYEEPWRHWISNWKSIKARALENSYVKLVFPRISVGGMLMHNSISLPAQGEAIDAKEESKFFHALNIIEGKNLTNEQEGILLGSGLAKGLQVHPGEEIDLYTKTLQGRIAEETLTVIGIFQTGNVDFDGRSFRIQLNKAQSMLRTQLVESISLGLSDQSHWKEVAKNLREAFPALESASFSEIDKVYYQHSVDWLKMQFFIVRIIILSIVLLGIFNTISSSILERKQEIGNLRANGESSFDVLKLILLEGGVLGLIGTAVGLLLTYAIAKEFLHQGILMPPAPGFNTRCYISFYFSALLGVITFGLSLISSLLASFFAGLKVARMSIAKALRAF